MSREGYNIFNLQFSNFRKGFTLVEVVILLGIVGIVLSGILTVYLNVITFNKDSALYSQAYKIADSRIEVLRGGSFDSITSTTENVSALPQGQAVTTVTNNIDGALQTDIKKVELKLRWYFRNQKEIKLVTLVARNGIVQ